MSIERAGGYVKRSLDAKPMEVEAASRTYPSLIAIVVIVAALYFGREVFLPLAMAILLTFAMAPAVSLLRRWWFPKTGAIAVVVFGAFSAIVLFGMIVASQLATLAQNLPVYQSNIEAKIQSIREAGVGEGIFEQISNLLDRLGRQIEDDANSSDNANDAGADANDVQPIPVEVVPPALQPLQVLQTIVGPLLGPLAMGGIIIVVVVFMLMKREDLRDRFIRLVGSDDLHRTTEALQEAGARVGQYLLMQTVVNAMYAIPIGIGLWLIGIPNAPLWALMALVLRFVPYIGPILAAVFPLALSVAVDPGWSMLAWTVGLYAVLELTSNNIIEPWLYGSRTGLSPLAIIISAIFWTWLWGPLGLLLSTPLTVCLVVLGRHVPQFGFLDVLFGNEPVLEPHQNFYQRLLAGDPVELSHRAEEFLEEDDLITFYETVAIPALTLAEEDRARRVVTGARLDQIAADTRTVVENLEDFGDELKPSDADTPKSEDGAGTGNVEALEDARPPLPDAAGKRVLCVGGRTPLDDAAMSMLAQILEIQNAEVEVAEHAATRMSRLRAMDLKSYDTVVIGFLGRVSSVHARYVVRRFKQVSQARIGVVFWSPSADATDELAKAIGCDFVSRDITNSVELAVVRKAAPRRSRKKAAAPAVEKA